VVPTLSSKLDFCTSPSHLCILNRAISLKAARDVKIQNGYLQTLTYVTHPSQTTMLLSYALKVGNAVVFQAFLEE
jgi:hypothetical protein